MEGLLRKLLIWICVPIYNLIPSIYSIFYNLASARFLTSDVIEAFSQNLYVLISVVMLFGFSITILTAIINPDLMSDNKKGVPALFKRSFIGLCLIILVPFMFDKIYDVTKSIMSNSLIEKIIVGNSFCDENSDPDCEKGGNGGQVIAGTLIASVLYPSDDSVEISASSDVGKAYADMVQVDIGNISSVAKNINAVKSGGSSDDDYAFHFDGLIAIIAGIGICYMLILFAIDMAVRVFKLAFLELTAPISIVAYIGAGNKILSSWFKEVGKTFVEVFVRIASIAFYLFLISNLSTFITSMNADGKSWGFFLKCFLIVGMLIFANQIPSLISSIFGIEMKSKGGIGGRIGQMAGVGKQAQKAWNIVRNPIAAGAAIGAGVGGFAAHAGIGAVRSVQRGKAVAEQIRAEKGKAAGIRGFLAGAGGMVGAALTTPSALVRGVKSGATNKNLSAIGNEVDRYDNTHPEGSTFLGRAKENAKSFVGWQSSAASELARLDKEKVRIDAEIDYNNSIQQISKSIKDAIKNSIEKSDSKINIGLVTTDKNGKLIAYNGNYNQIQERINAERTAAANLTGQARTDEFARLSKVETKLNEKRKKLTKSYLDDVLDNTSVNHKKAIDDLGVGTTNTILQQKSEFETRTGKTLKDADFLDKTNDAAGEALYIGDATKGIESLYSQQAKNQEERRERNSAGNLTEYGKMVQNDNAIKARNNGNKSEKK